MGTMRKTATYAQGVAVTWTIVSQAWNRVVMFAQAEDGIRMKMIAEIHQIPLQMLAMFSAMIPAQMEQISQEEPVRMTGAK
jgi:uncharacterized membrane protein YagU involved in acid resistance